MRQLGDGANHTTAETSIAAQKPVSGIASGTSAPVAHEVSDEQLMASIKGGDIDAFGQLYERYKSRMLNYFYRRLIQIPVAEEMLQDLFVSIFESAQRFDTSKRFAPWIYTCASNMCKDYYKHQERAARGEAKLRQFSKSDSASGGPAPSAEDEVLSGLNASLVRDAIDRLPPIEREVLVRHEYEGASYQDIANELECSVQTVRWRKHSAMKTLRDLLIPLLREGAK